MLDVELASAYAGASAQEEDTLGLPTFAQFKKHATFRTELADFGVDLRQLSRLLAECDYGFGAGGMGLGDLNILFNSTAKRVGALNYEGVLRLCRMLRPRLAKVQAMMAATDPEQGDPVKCRASRGTASATAPTTSGATAANGTWASSRGLPHMSSLHSRSLHRPQGGAPLDFEAAMAAGEGGGGGGSLTPAQPTSLTSQAGARGVVSFRQQVIQGRDRDGGPGAPARPFSASARPSSASRLSLTSAPNDPAAAAAAGGAAAGSLTGGEPSASGRGAVPTGLGTLMALRDPPVLLREQLPPPPCTFPSIAARIAGIQVLYRDGEMTRVALAIRDLQRDWEQAATAAAVSQAVRRQAMATASSSSAAASANEAPPRGEIPVEGRIWLLLLHACSLMLEGNHRSARRSLQAAEGLYNPDTLGLEHPYHYCIHMFFGLLNYYEQHYNEAIDNFETAREVAEQVSRGSLDVAARRNAAACLNNKGVCHSLLGNRADAVVAFRAAYQMLRAVAGVPDAPEAVVAQRNLNKAVKQGFALNTARLRPTSAPPMYSLVGSTSVPRERKLQTFLQSAITMRAPIPVTAPPAWCNKVTADDIIARKKLKELEKKAKAKQAAKGKSDKSKALPKPKKPPPFESMVNFPFASYGVSNVKLAVKKGRKKKAAPKSP